MSAYNLNEVCKLIGYRSPAEHSEENPSQSSTQVELRVKKESKTVRALEETKVTRAETSAEASVSDPSLQTLASLSGNFS